MKTSALTLQHHLTNCMRLFAVMLLLTYTYTATAQTTDTLKHATPDKRWGIGVMVGTPDRTIVNNVSGLPESKIDVINIHRGARLNFSYGISLFRNLEKNRIRFNFYNSIKKIKGENTFDFLSNGGGYENQNFSYRFNIYNVNIGYEFVFKQNKFEFGIFSGPTIHFYSKGKNELYRTTQGGNNLPIQHRYEINTYQMGFAAGLCIAPSVSYKITPNIYLGAIANINLLYAKTGGAWFGKITNTDNGSVIEDEQIPLNIKGFFITPTVHFNLLFVFDTP